MLAALFTDLGLCSLHRFVLACGVSFCDLKFYVGLVANLTSVAAEDVGCQLSWVSREVCLGIVTFLTHINDVRVVNVLVAIGVN